MLSSFLRLLLYPAYCHPEAEVRSRLGDHLVDDLVALGMLRRTVPKWFRCHSYPQCARRVEKIGSRYYAMPPPGATCCTMRLLESDELQALELSRTSCVHALRSVYQLEGSADLRDPQADCFFIGHRLEGGSRQDYLLCLARNLSNVGSEFLRYVGGKRRAVVLCPSRGALVGSAEFEAHLVASGCIAFLYLDEDLCITEGAFARAAVAPVTAGPSTVAPSAYCFHKDHEQQGMLSRQGYDALVHDASRYDLLIDAMADLGNYVGFHVRADGHTVTKPVAKRRAALAVELILAGKPLRYSEVRTLDPADSREDLYYRLRGDLAEASGGKCRELFRRRSGGDAGSNKLLSFSPPPGFRYCVVLPTDHALVEHALAQGA